MGHARALITIENVAAQLDIFKKILDEGLSVRKVEELARIVNNAGAQAVKKEETKTEEKTRNPEIQKLQDRLSSHFGTRVLVNSDNKKHKGEIKIPFVSVEDLNRILEILNF